SRSPPMSRRVRLLILVALAAAVVAVRAPLPAQPTEEGRKVALVVGVEKYDGTGLRNLDYAEKDATDLAAVLTKLGYRVTLLTRAEFMKQDRDHLLPMAKNIRDHLSAITKNRKPSDTVLGAFSGHGAHLKATDKHYFCPTCTDLRDEKSLVAVDDVLTAFKASAAGSKVLLMDACRNDPTDGRSGGGPEELRSITRPVLPDLPGGTVALFSCSK